MRHRPLPAHRVPLYELVFPMYRVQLQDFEGPLDLLLFFIQRDELDIYDIPISKITDEFLAYLRILEQIDLDSVGDFIYMSAQLINIKARMLLPSTEVDEEGEPVDPRRELVKRLLTYMQFKEAAQSLTDNYEDRGNHFTRSFSEQEKEQIIGVQGVELEVSVFSLISALQRVLTEVPDTPVLPVHRNQYSLESQRDYVLEHLAFNDRLSFVGLINGRPKHFVIVTFLVILEMAQQGQVSLLISPDGGDFYLERAVTYGGASNGASNGHEEAVAD